jgi:hypothetical protein
MMEATIQAIGIGHIASQVLQRNHSLQVAGVSSQGIYLQPIGDLTLFLTSDHFRGPLTLNIPGEAGNLPSVHPGDVALRTGDLLVFESDRQAINIRSPRVWTPPKPPEYMEQPKNHFAEVLQKAGSILPDHPHFSLLESAVNGEPLQFKEMPDVGKRIAPVNPKPGTGNPAEIISGMKSILGAGPGLTPLGDDLLIGILLVFSRSGRYKFKTGDQAAAFQTLLDAALDKTTTLSWSLLHCAAQGSGDERIIKVLDGLIAGREIPDQDLQNLLAWGSSSGIAVLAGMLLVL